VWVDDVDEMHKHCVAAGLEFTLPPTDMPWHVRETFAIPMATCSGCGADWKPKSRMASASSRDIMVRHCARLTGTTMPLFECQQSAVGDLQAK
jgi:predicted nucleic acid-binding Zn ribbon protein